MHAPALERDLAHANEVLSDAQQSLLAFVPYELRPVDEMFVDLFDGALGRLCQFDLLPATIGEVRTLGHFHVEIADALLFAHCRVLTVRQRTCATIAQTGQIVLIATEHRRLGSALDKALLSAKTQ